MKKRLLFSVDFWNGGVLSLGCVATGRTGRSFHVGCHGNIAPSVFLPYHIDKIDDLYAQCRILSDALKLLCFSTFGAGRRNTDTISHFESARSGFRKRAEVVLRNPWAVEASERFWEAAFVAFWSRTIREGVLHGPFRAVALGASGGVDSAVSAALCAASGVPTLAVQMIDRRVMGERYNPDVYERLGAELIPVDITAAVREREKPLRLPPYWTTQFGLQMLARVAPRPLLWALVVRVKGSPSPPWVGRHYERLLSAHKVRKGVLETIAAKRGAAIVVCANRTELELGYFVEGGIDDVAFGRWAPLAGLYKFQVRRLAVFLGLPPAVLAQRPSPGFGGVGDEHFLGPYELVDLALLGFRQGRSDSAVLQTMTHYAQSIDKRRSRRLRPFLRPGYVHYLRCLWRHSLGKGRAGQGGRS